jgi:hypothetical protein
MIDLAELITKLKLAKGPSRELDGMIAIVAAEPIPTDPAGWPPRYTESLDAALTLAPKDSAIGLTDNPDDPDGRYRATVMPPLPAERGSDQTVYHKVLAIALCIAALKSFRA